MSASMTSRYVFARSFGYGRYRSVLYALYGARWQVT